MLKKWEQGDKQIIELWKKMNSWAYQGIEKTYKKFGVKFDKNYYESKIYKKGKQIVQQGLEKGIFKNKEDGAVSINLGDNLGEKILLRKDGTSVYITQDLYLAKQKYKDYKFDKSIYVVANEQNYHFKVLFKIINKLNLEFSSNLLHLSYGMVFLPEGKMKSRQGTVVDADDLIKKTEDLAEKEINKRYNLKQKEVKDRRLKIALSAIKYELLKIDPIKSITFNPKKAIKFEGDTGPYLEYSYARACSILRKAKQGNSKNIKIPELKEQEIKLIKKISEFPQTIKRAHDNLSPNLIANYSFELAHIFNEFYHTCPVISSKEKDFRLKLVESFKKVMNNSLFLLGIESVKEM
jgi:arginyl-tRNA synthetase